MQKKNTRPNRERKKEKKKMIDTGEKQNTEKGLEYKKKKCKKSQRKRKRNNRPKILRWNIIRKSKS